MDQLRRILSFTGFSFAEYVRSGRIVIELVATVLFWAVFLRQYPVPVEQYFSLTSILALLMTLYTSTALLGLGERPQGYVILTRPLGRSGYILSLYLVAVIVVALMFFFVTGLYVIYNYLVFDRVFELGLADMAKGALPLLLNVALLAALMTLLSSLVLANAWRLALLAILAVALYSNAWHLWPVYRFIEPFQSLFSWPIYPAVAGFRLSTTRDYSGGAIWILLAQAALAVLLLSVALSSFRRRDVILRS